jgi:hypothetical protein
MGRNVYVSHHKGEDERTNGRNVYVSHHKGENNHPYDDPMGSVCKNNYDRPCWKYRRKWRWFMCLVRLGTGSQFLTVLILTARFRRPSSRTAATALLTSWATPRIKLHVSSPKGPDHQDGAVATHVRGPLDFRHCTGSVRIHLVSEWTTRARLGSARIKASISEKYGPPEALRMAEIEKPVPVADEALVKVLAVSVNPDDWRSMRAKPFFSRAAAAKTYDPRR